MTSGREPKNQTGTGWCQGDLRQPRKNDREARTSKMTVGSEHTDIRRETSPTGGHIAPGSNKVPGY